MSSPADDLTLKNFIRQHWIREVDVCFPGNIGFLQTFHQPPVLLLQFSSIRLLYPIRQQARQREQQEGDNKIWGPSTRVMDSGYYQQYQSSLNHAV